MSVTRNSARTLSGKIISDKMDKTVTVMVERRVKHPIYGKILTKSTKIKAHDETNMAHMGDTVTIAECRPVSKYKSWNLISIDQRATVQ